MVFFGTRPFTTLGIIQYQGGCLKTTSTEGFYTAFYFCDEINRDSLIHHLDDIKIIKPIRELYQPKKGTIFYSLYNTIFLK